MLIESNLNICIFLFNNNTGGINMNGITDVLTIIASVVLLFAVYFSFKLSRETKHEGYWLSLSLGLFIFAVHHWLMIPSLWGNISDAALELVENITSILGGILIVYSTYGLYKSMKTVKQKVE